MLHDNIRTFRKTRGMTQEELAVRLNVVRQTVSKWEKGQSVPDADLLQKLAEILEVPVSGLLGGMAEREPEQTDEIALQLSRINEQLAIRNRRGRRVWRFIGILFGSMVCFWLVSLFLMMIFSFAGPVVTQEVVVHESTCEQNTAPME